MIALMLMRHAKSDWADESLSDFDRPLNARRKKSCSPYGRMDAGESPPSQLESFRSTATRAKETLYGLQRAWAKHQSDEVIVEFVDELYLAMPSTILNAIEHHHREAERLLVIGKQYVTERTPTVYDRDSSPG
jgi:phosphohistidine phosphatase